MQSIRPISVLKNTPTPSALHLTRIRDGWQTYPLFMSSSNSHFLVDVRSMGIAGANHYFQESIAPYYMRIPGSIPNILVRRNVVSLLLEGNHYLRKFNMEFFLFDAWRPQAVQHYCRNIWFPAHLHKKYPQWSPYDIASEVDKYWADAASSEGAINPHRPPPHSTGAAVDITIRHTNGAMLDMGTGFDDCSHLSHIDAFEYAIGRVSKTANTIRCNRRLLAGLMQDLGFVGHPHEWWHWSYGDQAWAIAYSRMLSIEIRARYRAVNPLPFLGE